MRGRLERRRRAATRHADRGELDAAVEQLSGIPAAHRTLEDRVALGSLLAETGRAAESIPILRKALDAAPEHPVVLNNLGHAHREDGDLETADRLFVRLLAVDPVAGAYGRGVVARQTGDLSAAERWFTDAGPMRLARMALADVQELDGRPTDAISTLQGVLLAGPVPGVHRRLGLLHALHGDRLVAQGLLRTALRERPDDPVVVHMLAALTGDQRAVDADYVAALFDRFARGYDAHLGDTLATRVPAAFAAALGDVGRVLDLGCGTGQTLTALSGRTHAVGVDLSAGMLVVAAQAGLYDRLVHEGIVPFLRADDATYDTLLAADVFGYVDDLAPVLAAARGRGDRFAFTTEDTDAPGWHLGPDGRYAHSHAHVEAALGDWTVRQRVGLDLRRQGDGWVRGTLWVVG
jgi:predicted TPR repeat methyltransferase